jgi:hypothetical protein
MALSESERRDCRDAAGQASAEFPGDSPENLSMISQRAAEILAKKYSDRVIRVRVFHEERGPCHAGTAIDITLDRR